MAGAPDPAYIAARRVLLDALEALKDQLDALVLVGAQAIYMHTGAAEFAVAEYTTDGDIGIDPSALNVDPNLEEAMRRAEFKLDLQRPGTWFSKWQIEIDLLVPESLGGAGRRGARIPDHGKRAARKASGLEAALVDNDLRVIEAFEEGDDRSFQIKVAGPAALIVAKMHKLFDRRDAPGRLEDKDALDVFRILRAVSTADLADSLVKLRRHHLARRPTARGLEYLQAMFADPAGAGVEMVLRALTGLVDPEEIRQAVAVLVQDLTSAVRAIPIDELPPSPGL